MHARETLVSARETLVLARETLVLARETLVLARETLMLARVIVRVTRFYGRVMRDCAHQCVYGYSFSMFMYRINTICFQHRRNFIKCDFCFSLPVIAIAICYTSSCSKNSCLV